jgi:conjugative transposon TraN protein
MKKNLFLLIFVAFAGLAGAQSAAGVDSVEVVSQPANPANPANPAKQAPAAGSKASADSVMLVNRSFYLLKKGSGGAYISAPATDATTSGGMFQGYTRTIPYERMIPPYGLEVTFDKTVHIIFPAPISYVDLGSDLLLAGKAGAAENVLRIKSAEPAFDGETNMAVITTSGSFYTFNVKFAKEPEKLNVEMQDFTHDGSAVNRPNNSFDIYLAELHGESPRLVRLIMESIQKNNRRFIKHIGAREFGMQLLLKGIYSYNGMLYFHTEINNRSSVDYNIDYLTFRIVDRVLVKRTTMQETVLSPVRAFNRITTVRAKSIECTVFAIPVFTVMPEKKLQVDMHEKDGGRTLIFELQNDDLVHAKEIKNFVIN